MDTLRYITRKYRWVFWALGSVFVVATAIAGMAKNWSLATTFGLIDSLLFGIPYLLSEDVEKSDKPLPSSAEIADYSKKHPTSTLAETINSIRQSK